MDTAQATRSKAFSYHAPAALASHLTVNRQADDIHRHRFDMALLDALVQPMLVTNPHRQIVFINRAAAERFSTQPADAVGLRLGDLVDCVHVADAPSGCGTGQACRSCGWTNAMLAAQDGPVARPARLLLKSGEAIDAVINAVPVQVSEEQYIVNEIQDVSAEARRLLLEQTFFHDILNVATAVKGLIEISCAAGSGAGADPDLVVALKASTDRLIEEIRSQRTVSEAQDGRLVIRPETIGVERAVSTALGTVLALAADRGVTVATSIDPGATPIRTDHTLLGRALTNLAKNAVEASGQGDTVRIEVTGGENGGVHIAVGNTAVMSRVIRDQVFHRSFSTKGRDRGIGTYSTRLLVEQYLRGQVIVESSAEVGTVFSVTLPHDVTKA